MQMDRRGHAFLVVREARIERQSYRAAGPTPIHCLLLSHDTSTEEQVVPLRWSPTSLAVSGAVVRSEDRNVAVGFESREPSVHVLYTM